jgi:hypothetical protein
MTLWDLGRLLAMKELCFMREFYSGKPEAIWVVGILLVLIL